MESVLASGLADDDLCRVELAMPFLVVRFPQVFEVTSWAIVNGGRRRAGAVAWVEVRNADLSLDVDPERWLTDRLESRGLSGAVGLLTSRRIACFTQAQARADGIAAQAVATVGLSNALRVGDPPGMAPRAGTINVLCAVSGRLTEAAALEALSIATEARTAAVTEAQVGSRRSGLPATGTGTDCLVLAWAPTGAEIHFTGKHTAAGHVVGQAVFEAVREGTRAWLKENRCTPV